MKFGQQPEFLNNAAAGAAEPGKAVVADMSDQACNGQKHSSKTWGDGLLVVTIKAFANRLRKSAKVVEIPRCYGMHDIPIDLLVAVYRYISKPDRGLHVPTQLRINQADRFEIRECFAHGRGHRML